MQHKLFIFLSISIPIFISFLFTYPRYTEEDDVNMRQKYLTIKEDLLSVMTFNIRVDILERDPNNNFSKRIHRLTEIVEKWEPAILNVQEAFTDQLQHWQSHLPRYYQSIGYEHDRTNSSIQHLLSHMDFQVAILYNNQILKLLEQDYLWLSKTPRIVGSKDWDSHAVRTLNIARFQLISEDDNSTHILVFNTHLDSKGEQARQEQAKIVRSTINKWQKKYSTDVVLLFGDINSIPKQTTYDILTSAHFLYDTWTICKAHLSSCISNSFSSTFHGWLGSILNTYGVQFLQTIAFTFHGLGVILPHGIPRNYSLYIDIFKKFTKNCRMIDLSEMISLWSSHRFHVDWILYQNSIDGSKQLEPRFISVIDIRSRNYSSDHFPVIALFQLKKI
jgi:endonuclease/exonuclease/phosphatase family metal-dependent hydrolase